MWKCLSMKNRQLLPCWINFMETKYVSNHFLCILNIDMVLVVDIDPHGTQTAMKVGPSSVLSSRRWANVSPTYIAVWEDKDLCDIDPSVSEYSSFNSRRANWECNFFILPYFHFVYELYSIADASHCHGYRRHGKPDVQRGCSTIRETCTYWTLHCCMYWTLHCCVSWSFQYFLSEGHSLVRFVLLSESYWCNYYVLFSCLGCICNVMFLEAQK